ncbi:LytR/AlgR family response regulator transcription factor [Anaerophaga thermohalophila]|uniref:LytR/AlgR family response regulator transcription factor n=1 Tax=Anaerophaga thermohalophila TaxID=177400 RepID=UPI0002D442B4|nr:LytTR family transcriptional regulator DNA-binding domain-containing protein [Anaerophaga thermohalophila]
MSNKVSVLIVEDEIMIAEDIAMRLDEVGYETKGIVDNVDEAIVWLEEQRPDILLVDISLKGDKTGLDLARLINERFQLPFIFLSSLANQSVIEKARQVKPSAYLLKPFNDKQVRVAIELALFNFYGDESKESHAPCEEHGEQHKNIFLQMPGCLFLRSGNAFIKVNFEDILWLEADSNYTVIHTKQGKFTYSTVLKKFEEKLPQKDFVRVHRTFIVNLSNVTGFEGNMLLVGDKEIPVNKSCRDMVFSRFRTI